LNKLVALSLGLLVGGLLTGLGAVICIYWYVYWERNFKGELITDGLYSVVRHPFYTGFILLAIGLTLVFPSYETRFLAVITLAVMVVFVPKEEEQLIREYKDEYRRYMKKTRWRLIPFIY